MATLLRTVGIPEICDCLVKRFQRLELYAILIFIMLTHIHQIVGKLLVVLRLQIILATIRIATHASTIGHVIGTRIAESLKHSIGTQFLDLQHNLPLRGIAVPVVLVATEALEAFHLSTQSLAPSHVVGLTVVVLRVIATTNVIAEMGIVKTRGTGQPFHNLGNLRVRPFSTLTSPPAERHAPSIEMLAHQLGVYHIAERVGGWCGIHLCAEVPQMLHVRTVLVRINLLVSVITVSTQVSVICLTAQFDKLAQTLLNGKLSLVN